MEKEIFEKLQISDTWEKYFKNYAQGATVVEQLINWVSQTNNLIKNVNDWNIWLEGFVNHYSENLKEEIRIRLQKMYDDGVINEIINNFIKLKGKELDITMKNLLSKQNAFEEKISSENSQKFSSQDEKIETLKRETNSKIDEKIQEQDSKIQLSVNSQNEKIESIENFMNNKIYIAQLYKNASFTNDQKGFSNCVIIHNEENCVVYDMGNDDGSRCIEYLKSRNIQKVDALIVSHWHSDHCGLGRIKKLIESDINTQSIKIFTPHKNLDYSKYQNFKYSEALNELNSYFQSNKLSIISPQSEGESYNFGEINVKFYNVSSEKFEKYYDYLFDEDMKPISYTNYNNFSMPVKLKINGKNVFLSADLELPSQREMAENIKDCDIIQISHHGLNCYSDEKYCSSISAQIAMIPVYGVRREKAISTASNLEIEKASKSGCVLSNHNVDIVIEITRKNGLTVLSGETVSPWYMGQKLKPNTDLNSVREPGIYFVQNSSEARTIKNLPRDFTSSFKMLVTNKNQNSSNLDTLQFLTTTYSSGDMRIYIRASQDPDDGTGYGNWFKVNLEKL